MEHPAQALGRHRSRRLLQTIAEPRGYFPEVVVAEVTAGEFAIRPIHYAVGVKLVSAYSLTAINASVADLRSLASMLITGT